MDAYPKAWQQAARTLRPGSGKTQYIQPHRLMRTPTTTSRPARLAAIALLAIATLAVASSAWGRVPQQPLSANPLDGYVAGVARAWEPYTAGDGRVDDPLDPADTGDNYGVILLADVMLKVARRTGDSALEGAGTRIIASALTLPVPNDPFNLLAIAAAIHDGQEGDFPAGAWERIAGPLTQRAGQIGPPTGATCLTEPPCYDNWRLVWSAGASLLLADRVGGAPGSLAADSVWTAAQIRADLALAVGHAGAPLAMAVAGEGTHESRKNRAGALAGTLEGTTTGGAARPAAGGAARELSDPGAEPPAYELFSTFMLELIGEQSPGAINPAVAKLRRQADRYALDMMAPDGQLSLSGRSLDQSWVQAAAAALGARRAALAPGDADVWRAYADRAVAYLLAAYPIRPDGVLPIVPGLDAEWNPSIMDGYAALNQYEGLTLWLLSDALAQWPRTEASRASIPGDSREMLADDLGSSGLVWGRAGRVWWQLSGRTTGNDPRSAQGLVAVKVDGVGGWRDVLALRPLHHGLSSTWALETARSGTADPIFTRVRGTGRRVVLIGSYIRANGRVLAHALWTLRTTARGIKLSMSVPAKATLHTTVWLAGSSRHVSARAATTTRGQCIVTASGRACPVTVYWSNRHSAVLEVSA
jgi:hypothetical protein